MKRASEAAAKKSALKDFVIEYSKSSRAACRGCEQKIMKDEVRISKKDFGSDGKRYGGQDMWHHLSCFAKLRSELGYYESASALPGFKNLSKEDQQKTFNRRKKKMTPAQRFSVTSHHYIIWNVYVSGKDEYTAVLGLTDIQKQKNGYFKLQLLEADVGKQYYLFRSWGRIGWRLDDFSTLLEAKKQFYFNREDETKEEEELPLDPSEVSLCRLGMDVV